MKKPVLTREEYDAILDATNLDPAARQKPVLTRAEYDQARAILDALPPGFYVKCGSCGGWYTGGKFTQAVGQPPECERCTNG